MILQVGIWAASVIGLAVLVWTAYYMPARKTVAVLGSLICTVVLTFASYFYILSHPAPLSWATYSSDDKAVVLGAHFQDEEGIYVFLLRSGEREPQFFVLPWNRKMAEELQKALKEAERDGTAVEMLWPEEKSLERREPMFHALPQPAMPLKEPNDLEKPEQRT